MGKDRNKKNAGEIKNAEYVRVKAGTKAELSRSDSQDLEIVKLMHGTVLAGAIYKRQIAECANCEQMKESTYLYADDLLKAMKPRDPLEEMLIYQALWTHARLAQLHLRATAPQTMEGCRTLHEAIDRAANTFRRQMLALAEYRNPRRGDSFTLVRTEQANLANQQIVNPAFGKENTPNEQGANHGDTGTDTRQPAQPKALEGPHAGRTDPLTGSGTTPQTMAAQHRPKNARRKVTLKTQCP